MHHPFTRRATAAVSAFRTVLRGQAGFGRHPFRKLNSRAGRDGLATGTVTFGTGHTYHQGGFDSAVYAMTL
jgi:hypothetical protein